MESGWQNRKIVENPQVVLRNNNIPQDIVDEILTRLPVKSLFRFKVVSKLWHSTISNPSFRTRSPATSVFAMSSSSAEVFYLMDKNGGIEKFRVPAWSSLEFKDSVPAMSNACNGVLLLRHGTSIFLFNPSTRYIDRVLTLDKYYDDEYDVDLRFCYDESIGDYKAVIFLWHLKTGYIYGLVASLKKKKWTALRIPNEFLSICLGSFVNNRLHLKVALRHSGDYGTHYDAIVYFNPIKNVFEKVACPQPASEDEDTIIGLGALDCCLCLTRRTGVKKFRGDVEVLKMQEYGVAESWTTLFVIKNSYDIWLEPLLVTKTGNILMKDAYSLFEVQSYKREGSKFN